MTKRKNRLCHSKSIGLSQLIYTASKQLFCRRKKKKHLHFFGKITQIRLKDRFCSLPLSKGGSNLPREFPRILSLESVDYFRTSGYFSGPKRKNINKQNFEVYWKTKTEDQGSEIQDRLKKLEIY